MEARCGSRRRGRAGHGSAARRGQGCGGGCSAGHGGCGRAIESAGIQSADDLEGHGRGGEAEEDEARVKKSELEQT